MTHTHTTRYRRLEIEDVDRVLRDARLEWSNIGISAADTTVGVATLRNLPERGRNGVVIRDFAKFVSNQLEGAGAIQVRFDVPENRCYFKVIEDATADED